MTKNVHCEKTGILSSLAETVVLTKIRKIIVLKNLGNSFVDEKNRMINLSGGYLKYYSEISIPSPFKGLFGRLFTTVDDEEDLEQSTAILSEEGKELLTNQNLMPLSQHIEQYPMLELPSHKFMAFVDTNANISKTQKRCDSWGIVYDSVGKKYRYKQIVGEKTQQRLLGVPSPLLPGFDVGISDCSSSNPVGTGYLFKTDNNFININLCSNESAVDFCIKNKLLVYYNDFLNNGALRVLAPYTENINKNLNNTYLFRSSNV